MWLDDIGKQSLFLKLDKMGDGERFSSVVKKG